MTPYTTPGRAAAMPKPAVLAAHQFQPTEREPVLYLVELGDPILVEAGEGVPLAACLVGAADRAALHRLELRARVVTQRVEARV